MNQCEEALVDYFQANLKDLQNPDPNIGYHWKIRNIAGFNLNGHSDYKANVELKEHFRKKWRSTSGTDRYALAEEIVKNWGGINGHVKVDGNISPTLKKYVHELEKEEPNAPLKGVASYSKIFSMADFDKYAIYDSRVAASLNAIQYIYNIKTNKQGGIAFHYVSGRNNIIGHNNYKTKEKKGFVYRSQFKRDALTGWEDISKDKTYEVYLKTLKNCLKEFPDYKLYDLEMLLFSNAEKECRAAMNLV